MIYLDYQATTPVAPEVADAMRPWIVEKFANPHSPSRWGAEASAAIEIARKQVEAAIGLGGGSVAFTGSATAAINWAIKGTVEAAAPGRNRIVTVQTEHAAVLDTCEWLEKRGIEVAYLQVGSDGLLKLDDIRDAVDDKVALVVVMLVNNEIGVIQSVGEIAEVAHDTGALMLCDAVQGLGRVDIPDGPDLVAVSAHKVYGPKGIGALWIRDGVTLAPLLHGGDQEGGRSGTLSPALCSGFGAAALLLAERREADAAHVERLWQVARERLPGWTVNGTTEARYRGNLSVRRDGVDVARLMSDVRDVAFSAGSACASGSGRASHVLRALGLSESEARASIRLGFGRYTTQEELREAAALINQAAARMLEWA